MSMRIASETFAEFDAIALGELESVFVPGGVLMASSGANGITGSGSQHRALVYGEIQAALAGVTISGADATVTVGRDGVIAAGFKGIALAGDGGSVLNRGLIEALDGAGVALTGSFSAGPVGTGGPPSDGTLRVRNSGTITGYTAITTADRLVSIINDGTLNGLGGVALDIGAGTTATGGAGTHVLTNRGEIYGAIHVGAGDLTLANAGLVQGDVTLLSGAVRLINDGRIEGDLQLGGTSGKVVNTGVIAGDVTTDGLTFADTVFDNARGTVTGSIDLGDGNDRYIAGASADGAIVSGGAGGEDVVSFIRMTEGVTFSLFNGQLTEAVQGTARFNGFEQVVGSNFADVLTSGVKGGYLSGAGGDDTLYGDAGNDNLSGNNGADTLYGGKAADTLSGGEGDDKLYGEAGADTLNGGRGNDILAGGLGGDLLTGGAGRDTFAFDATSLGQASPDYIPDFSGASGDGDKINLAAIDANTATPLDDPFTFIGTAAFHNIAGELRLEVGQTNTLVKGDIDGNGTADFTINVSTAYALKAVDFIL